MVPAEAGTVSWYVAVCKEMFSWRRDCKEKRLVQTGEGHTYVPLYRDCVSDSFPQLTLNNIVL